MDVQKKKVEVDFSGRVDQKSYDSVVVMLSKDRELENSAILTSKLKREILNQNKEIKDIIGKVHCILIYFCVKDFTDKISKMKICPDCSPKKIDQYLKAYFKEDKEFKKIKRKTKGIKHSSSCHKKALRIFRGKEKPRLKLTKEKILNFLKEHEVKTDS